jgi:hypothetical protein
MSTNAGALYYQGRRAGKLQGAELTINSNSTQEITDEGPNNTNGVITGTISADLLVPEEGTQLSILEDLLFNRDVVLTYGIVDGAILEFVDCRCTKAQYTANVKDGTLKGKFEWNVSKPNRIPGPGPALAQTTVAAP